MGMTPIQRKLCRQDLFQHCRYRWHKVVRRITIDSPPVFIVGCGHSGTSLLLAILGTHSRIYSVPYESYIATKDNQQWFQNETERFDWWAISAGKRRWVEKTPRHIHHIGRILKWHPDARILLMIRDGRDVACSIRERAGSLEKGIRRWVEDNLAGKEYWKHPNVHLVKYDDLVGDFRLTVRDVLNHLNEEYEDGMEDYYKIPRKWMSEEIGKPPTSSERDHGQYRNWQINQPLFDGRGRWKKLSDEELSLINDVGGEMLAECGYSDSFTSLHQERTDTISPAS